MLVSMARTHRGFRWPWLARRTNGRWGLGRWTQEDVDRINARAAADYREMHGTPCPAPGRGACRHQNWEAVESSVTGEHLATICADCFDLLPLHYSGEVMALHSMHSSDPIAYVPVSD